MASPTDLSGLVNGGSVMSSFWTIMLIILGAVVAAILIIIVIFVVMYSFKIVVKKEDGTRYKKKARKIKVGGVYQLRMWRPKRVLIPGDMIGKKTYYYFEDKTGNLWPYYWQNLHTALEEDPSYPFQAVVRMMTDYTQKSLKDLTAKQNWMEKYGTLAIGIVLVFLLIISVYLNTQTLSKSTQAAQGVNQEIAQSTANLYNTSQLQYQTTRELAQIWGVKSSTESSATSGLVPAGGP